MVAESVVRLRVEASDARRELRQTQRATDQLEAAVKGAAGGVGLLGTALRALPFIGVADAARRFFAGFAEADRAAAAVKTLGVDAQALNARLLDVSNQTNGLVSQTQLLTASYDVASAGFTDAASAANILRASALGATGGLSDLQTVADATTSVLNAYGLSSDRAGKIVDGFIQTQNDGKIIVAQYAAQIGRIAPIAAAAGVGIEELNAAISAVTATGVPVEATFTGLRQAISTVIKPSAEAQTKAKELGLEFNTAAIKTKGFAGFLQDVIDKTGGSEVALTKLFGSVEAVGTILPLANDDLAKFNTSLENQKNSAGNAQKAVDDLGATVGATVGSIVNNLGNIARGLDTVLGPALKRALTDVNALLAATSRLLGKFSDLETGGVSRATASLAFLASTGAASEQSFVRLREEIAGLNPTVASSQEELNKFTRVLDNAAGVVLRFPGTNTPFADLRDEVTGSIGEVRRLIFEREQLLAASSQNTVESDETNQEIQQAIDILDAQIEAAKKLATEKQKTVDLQRAGSIDLATSLRRQILLTNEEDEAKKRILERNFAIADISRKFPDLTHNEIRSLETLIDTLYQAEEAEIARGEAAKRAEEERRIAEDNARKAERARQKALEADPMYQMRQQFEELIKLENQVQAGAVAIGNAFSNSFKAVVTGTKSAKDAVADMLSSVAEHFLNMAMEIIAQQLAMIAYGTIMKALGIPMLGASGGGGGGGGAPSIDLAPAPPTVVTPPAPPKVVIPPAPSTVITPPFPPTVVTPPALPPVTTPPNPPTVINPPDLPPVMSPPAFPPVMSPPDLPPVTAPPAPPPVMTPPPKPSDVDDGPTRMYAKGGFVNSPTRALIAEDGESEYIIPSSKMREAMGRYSQGVRGNDVIPESGEEEPSMAFMNASNASIDVRYNVERINSVDYVTAAEFQRGMQSAAMEGAKRGEQQTLKRLQVSGSARKRIGL